MEVEITKDTRFNRPLSLKFGVIEFSPEEMERRKANFFRNLALFSICSLTAIGIGFWQDRSKQARKA